MAIDAQKRLSDAQLAAMQGRHAEALRGFMWFHEHALEQDSAFYGVRLSFALAYWAQLGKIYPKARRALERVVDKKTAALRRGKGNRALFHDVASINRYLERERDTHRLFKRLHSSAPGLAAECAGVAMPAIIRARDFALARQYTPEPEARLECLAESLKRDLKWSGQKTNHRAESRRAFIQIYCDRVNLLVRTLRGAGERSRAAAIRKAALKPVASAAVRKAVAAGLLR